LGSQPLYPATLDFYVSARVKKLAEGKQTPATAVPNTIPDFDLLSTTR
jgi:hypothetical protein